MNKSQIQTIRNAYLDLMGAKEAADASNPHAHDWNAHWETIKEMETEFSEELDGLVIYGEFATDETRSNGPHQ